MNPNFNSLNDEKTIEDFELQNLSAGMTLCGKYRLEREAGAGGMGVVWKAWDSTGERWVALKFIPPEIRHSEGAMRQVKQAFQTIQTLNHPNICPVYGLEKDPDFGYFVVMKWLDGRPLNEVSLSQEKIPEVLAKVADALDYAHSEKVMHRDVKPSNIFLGENGKVWLIDFGIAAEIQNSISMNTNSKANRMSGTRPYMAPEQWRGQHQDGRTDQYALGVVAYQLYSGHLPFEIPDVDLLCNAVLNYPPEQIENVSQSVNTAILRAMAKDRKGRFESCREFVDALSRMAHPRKIPGGIGCLISIIIIFFIGIALLRTSYQDVNGDWWQIITDLGGRTGVFLTCLGGLFLVDLLCYILDPFERWVECENILTIFIAIGLGFLLLWSSYDDWGSKWENLIANYGFWLVLWGGWTFLYLYIINPPRT